MLGAAPSDAVVPRATTALLDREIAQRARVLLAVCTKGVQLIEQPLALFPASLDSVVLTRRRVPIARPHLGVVHRTVLGEKVPRAWTRGDAAYKRMIRGKRRLLLFLRDRRRVS